MAGNVALAAYRFLRGGLVAMAVLLVAALIVERTSATCRQSSSSQTSISAFYFTTAHGIFIGTLYSIGAILIVYQGTSDTENTLLSLAGVLTFVIATVPITRPVLECGTADPGAATTRAVVLFNIWSVTAVLVGARVAAPLLFRRPGSPSSTRAAVWTQRAKPVPRTAASPRR